MPVTWRAPLRARDTNEEHRASTPLEAIFDLCFAVAVAQASVALRAAIAGGRVADALTVYPLAFFAIWWAWMNFTWFASAYDNDDVPFRLITLVQIVGALIIAAGIPRAFADGDLAVVTIGYTVSRVGQVVHWWRAAHVVHAASRTARRYALGVALVQAGWLARLALGGATGVAAIPVLVVAELAVPVWAERAGVTSWNAGHIAERYNLFTLIVLAESVLATTVAVQSALDSGTRPADLLATAGGGVLVVFSMWWLYFDQPAAAVVGRTREMFATSARGAFVWGYGHLVVFAGAAATGAGLTVEVERVIGEAPRLSDRGAGLALAVPVALFVLSVWLLHLPGSRRGTSRLVLPAGAVLVLVAALVPETPLVVGVILVATVIARQLSDGRGGAVVSAA